MSYKAADKPAHKPAHETMQLSAAGIAAGKPMYKPAHDSYILALDAGTSSERALLFDHEANLVASSQHSIKQIYPKPAWVEQDPMELLSTQLAVMTQVQFKSGIHSDRIAALGITNQRETTIIWDKRNGKPLYNAIVWQCRRTAPQIEELKASRPDIIDLIADKTGLILDPYFSASKIKWILDEIPEARSLMRQGHLAFGTVDSWLVYQLTKGQVHATDYTNASRTMLFNIHDLSWDQELLDLFEIDASILPAVQASSSYFGETSSEVSSRAIPIWACAGDQQASAFGHGCTMPKSVKNTYGTGCFIVMNTGGRPIKSKNGLITTIAIAEDGGLAYALEGSVFIGGAVMQWLRDELNLIDSVEESAALAQSLESNEGVYLVPAFTGLGAPFWNPEARGLICGLTRGSTKAHIVRAALESMAYQSADILDAMQADYGEAFLSPTSGEAGRLSSVPAAASGAADTSDTAASSFARLSVDGGASFNEFCMQFQADISNMQVERPELIETTALGAAYLAGLGCGYWSDAQELQALRRISQSFTPQLTPRERSILRAQWRNALKKAIMS